MAQRIVTLGDGMTKISVDGEGEHFGFFPGDIITADERHAKWQGKQVEVIGFTSAQKHKVIWGQVVGEKTADCAHDPEGLKLLKISMPPVRIYA